MARFYMTARGARGETTRTGTPSSGLGAHVRGWYLGLRVSMDVGSDGEDVATVYLTPGSAGAGHDVLIGRFRREDYDQLGKGA